MNPQDFDKIARVLQRGGQNIKQPKILKEISQLVHSVVSNGESSSCLVFGPPSSGKTSSVKQALNSCKKTLDFTTIYLDGLLYKTDTSALVYIARSMFQKFAHVEQLQKNPSLARLYNDIESNRFDSDDQDDNSGSFDDSDNEKHDSMGNFDFSFDSQDPPSVDQDLQNVTYTSNLMKKPSKLANNLSQALNQIFYSLKQRPVVFIIRNIEKFAEKSTKPQLLLYSLLNLIHDGNLRLLLIGITQVVDLSMQFEKRVKSRFSNRILSTLPIGSPGQCVKLLCDLIKNIQFSTDSVSTYLTSLVESKDFFKTCIVPLFNTFWSLDPICTVLIQCLIAIPDDVHLYEVTPAETTQSKKTPSIFSFKWLESVAESTTLINSPTLNDLNVIEIEVLISICVFLNKHNVDSFSFSQILIEYQDLASPPMYLETVYTAYENLFEKDLISVKKQTKFPVLSKNTVCITDVDSWMLKRVLTVKLVTHSFQKALEPLGKFM